MRLLLAPPQQPEEIGRLGGYRVLQEVGRGGMGVVYQAEDARLKRAVALKAMLPALAARPNAAKRFLREAQATAAVEHDHIVRIYQVDEDRGVPFLAMELLKGEPLEERLKRDGKLPVAEALRVGREAAEGLAAAHDRGLIHRDVKPANVWLEGERGRVKILDFGLARAAAPDSALTQEGAIIGTPAYMAPEQARGEVVDARCDLFSLGVLLYRACTGRAPFEGTDAMSVLLNVTTHEPTPPIGIDPELPPALSELIMKLLEKDPARRPAGAREVVQTLQALERALARAKEAGERTEAMPLPAPQPAAPRRGRRRLVLAVAAVVLLGGLIAWGAAALIRVQTDQGDYVIRTDDPDFSFQVHGGTVTLHDAKTKRTYALKVVSQDKPGEFTLEVADPDADMSFMTPRFTIKRGQQVALEAWFERKPAVAANPPPAGADEAFARKVAALPAEKQAQAVAAELKARNLDFDGKVTPTIENGVVTGLQFLSDAVTDLSPVRALPGLKTLNCAGTDGTTGTLSDLSALKGLPLTSLNCSNTSVSDLSALKGMPLTTLYCNNTQVSDLSPLQGMPLTTLGIAITHVVGLSALKGMPLTALDCRTLHVRSYAHLRGGKLLV